MRLVRLASDRPEQQPCQRLARWPGNRTQPTSHEHGPQSHEQPPNQPAWTWWTRWTTLDRNDTSGGRATMADSPRDRRHYEPQSAEELMREFPDWAVSLGTNMLWYAKEFNAADMVRGEDLLDLRDQIIKWIWTHRD